MSFKHTCTLLSKELGHLWIWVFKGLVVWGPSSFDTKDRGMPSPVS